MLNVVYGGTLIQDIPTELGVPMDVHRQPEDYAVVTHGVTVEPGTLLEKIEGTGEIRVNSRHHQAVKTLGKGLVLNARSTKDGIVESFNDPTKRFMLAVQWHPEMLSHERPEALNLFKALVSAAAAGN